MQAESKNNFIPNTKIQNKALYKSAKHDDLAKNHLDYDLYTGNNYVIAGEEAIGRQRLLVGAAVMTHASLGQQLVADYNERQRQSIKQKTFSHKVLCERRQNAAALLFLTIFDLVGEDEAGVLRDYKSMDAKDLCHLVRDNIQEIIKADLGWMVEHSRNIIRDYYNLAPNKLKIKLNYVLDDGVYPEFHDTNKGGLLLNGLLEELEYYQEQLSGPMDTNIGIICQILCPSGFIENRKWAQIDIGLTLSGKRLFGETVAEAISREALNQLHLKLAKPIVDLGKYSKHLYYGGQENGQGYEGCEIHIFEAFQPADFQFVAEAPLCYKFCKCADRTRLINDHKMLIKKLNGHSLASDSHNANTANTSQTLPNANTLHRRDQY